MTQQAARARCLTPGCPCRDARIVSVRRAEFVRARRADATAERRDLEPLPADWPTWPDRIEEPVVQSTYSPTATRWTPETGWV